MIITESKPDTCYLTAGGYLITLDKWLCAPVELSPEVSPLCTSGWSYNEDGKTPLGEINKQLSEKLRIIKELPFGIPKLPDGYKWAGGYPILREPKFAELYLDPNMGLGSDSDISYKHGHIILEEKKKIPNIEYPHIGLGRLIIEKDNAESTITKSDYVQTAKPVEFKVEINMDSAPQEKEDDFVDITETHPNHILRAGIDWIGYVNCPTDKVYSSAGMSVENYHKSKGKRVFCSKKDVPEIENKSIAMELLTMSKPTQQSKQSNLSYFVSEPLSNTYKFIKPSFRYILLYSVIGLIGYGTFNYNKVIDLAKKCLPVVNIEWRNQ